MSWINTLNGRSELRDCRLQQIKLVGDGYTYGPNDDVKHVNPVFTKYLDDNKARISRFRITEKGGLRDSDKGLTFYSGYRVFNSFTGKKGTWNPKNYNITWDPDPTTEEVKNKDLTKSGGDTASRDKSKGAILSKTTPATHTATYTAPAGATGAFAGKGGYGWTTNKWGWNGNKKGTLDSKVASNLKLNGNATAEQAQQFLIDKGYNITKDNVWGKQSLAAYDDYMNKVMLSEPRDEALKGEKNNTPISSPMLFKEAPTKPINMDALTNPKLNLHPGDQTALTMQIRNIKPLYRQYNRSETRDWLRMKNVNPYDLSGSDRRALRNYLSGDTTGKNYDINQLKGLNTKYNWELKFQQGGQITMNEEQQMQQAFLKYLAEQTGAKSEQELEQVIQQLGEDGLKQAYTQFVQAMQQQQVQAAKFGAKLNYIKHLKGQCPEGMQMQYYKVGGRICKKCMQMEQNGGELETPSNPIDAYGKQRYFTWNGKVYAAYKGDKATDKGFQRAEDNLQEQANALKDYNAGQHLGWDSGANKHANFRHNAKGTMVGILPEVTVTAKRVSSKLKANNLRKRYFDLLTAYVKKWHANMLGRFKNTMQNMGYNYNWNTGTYDKNGEPVYRLNNGLLQTRNIYTGNWNDINNSDALPGMPANGSAVRLQK